MNTVLRVGQQMRDRMLKTHPVMLRGLQLVAVLAMYIAGVALVDAATLEARLPVILTAVYFLPAVLRAWLLFYWQLRGKPQASDSNEQAQSV